MKKLTLSFICTLLVLVQSYAQQFNEISGGDEISVVFQVKKEFGNWTSKVSSEKIDAAEKSWRLKDKDKVEMMSMMVENPKAHLESSEIQVLKANNATNNINLSYYDYGSFGGPFATGIEPMLDMWLTRLKAVTSGITKYQDEIEGDKFNFAAKGEGVIDGKPTLFFVASFDRDIASNQVYLLTFSKQNEDKARQMVADMIGFDWKSGKFIE